MARMRSTTPPTIMMPRRIVVARSAADADAQAAVMRCQADRAALAVTASDVIAESHNR
jgi:hypothetical protein